MNLGDLCSIRGWVLAGTFSALTIGSGAAIATDSEDDWFLMSSQGACMEIAPLMQRMSGMTTVTGPHSYIESMQAKGYTVESGYVEDSKGLVFEAKVPDSRLTLTFAKRAGCKSFASQ